MLTKCLLSPLFSFPIPWIDKYYDNFNKLGESWKHIIFTDLPLKSRGNIEVVPMTAQDMVELTYKRLGVRPHIPAPSPKFGDLRPAFGEIFQDYFRADYWGHTDFDIAFGRVNNYITDDLLNGVEIFSTDPNAINGIFTLYQNSIAVNLLFTKYTHWESIFADTRYHAFDETEFTWVVRHENEHGRLSFMWKFWQENDNQPDHCPTPQIAYRDDGALINTKTGEEMMMFHFRRTKGYV